MGRSRRSPSRGPGRGSPAGPPHPARGRRLRPVDRVRQCREPHAGEDAGAAKGDRHSQRARREPRPPAAAVDGRDAPALPRGRRDGALPRQLRHGQDRRFAGGSAPALGGGPAGRVGPGVYPGGFHRNGSHRRDRARVAPDEGGHRPVLEAGSRANGRRSRRAPHPERSRRFRSGPVSGSPRRSGSPDPQSLATAANRPGVRTPAAS
jgi:hypothetical protein